MDSSDPYYVFLLDLFPLLDEVVENNHVLASAIEELALSGLREQTLESIENLVVLLSLARDLGYASPEVIAYLLRHAERLRRR